MAALGEFVIDIAPDVPQCPTLFINRQLLHTAIEFCKQTKIAEPPALTSTEVPDELFEFVEGISHGVKARLLAMPDKPWSNTSLVNYHLREFESAKADAKAANIIGSETKPLTIESKPFGY